MSGPIGFAVLAFVALVGLGVSLYVWRKQVTAGPVWCIGTGCAAVIRSRYGRLLGIPNGVWGTLFFGGLMAAAVTGLLIPRVGSPVLWVSLLAASVALVLHGYLTYLQIAVLRTFCSWCLTSAVLTLAAFLVLLAGVTS